MVCANGPKWGQRMSDKLRPCPDGNYLLTYPDGRTQPVAVVTSGQYQFARGSGINWPVDALLREGCTLVPLVTEDTLHQRIAALEAELAALRAERWQPILHRERVDCVCPNQIHDAFLVTSGLGDIFYTFGNGSDGEREIVTIVLPDNIRLCKRDEQRGGVMRMSDNNMKQPVAYRAETPRKLIESMFTALKRMHQENAMLLDEARKRHDDAKRRYDALNDESGALARMLSVVEDEMHRMRSDE